MNNDIAAGHAFDEIASRYDIEFDASPTTRRLRQQIYTLIGNLVVPPSRILDINCGTGTDVLFLATKGYSAFGVDVSEKMIAEASKKSDANSRTSFVRASYDDMDEVPAGYFDLVLSNFGGLNCTSDLKAVGDRVARRLKPQGFFVAVLMPSFSLWETCASLARGKFRQAFRRLRRGGTRTGFGENRFTVFYFNPNEAAKQFENNFLVRDIFAWNVFSPPPHSWRIARSFPKITTQLEKLDEVIGHLPFFRSIGDHYVMVLEKRPA